MKKVAILGGGVGALTTAFELTQPALNGQYDVTVFQMGWRLGGKGASGRDVTGQRPSNRIEEHGLHIWMGFYDNAFTMIQEVYQELGRTAPPLQTWTDAFKPHDLVVAMEPFNEGWERWEIEFPRNDFVPGLGPEPTLWELTVALLEWIERHWTGGGLTFPKFVEEIVQTASVVGTMTARSRELSFFATVAERTTATVASVLDPVAALIGHATKIAGAIPHDSAPSPEECKALAWLVRGIMDVARALLGPRIATEIAAFKQWVAVNLGCAAVIGMLEDDLLSKGWDSIDDLDLRAWLKKHGAEDVAVDSAPMRAIYDLVFAYVDGDTTKPAFAAGTAMRGMLRMLFTYKGAIFYKMQAGMGDTIFTPLYQVLQRRGVKFEFFHRVDDLHVDPATKGVRAIDMTEQVQLAGAKYQPLVVVNGLPCWPNQPLYDQIVDGGELRRQGINLESAWAPDWRGAKKKTVTCGPGQDFDLVVLGISIGSFPSIAEEVIAASPPFRDMVDHVKTVQTCAFQLWLQPDTAGLGYQSPSGSTQPPVLGAFVEPLDTWADMSHLLDRETWPTNAPDAPPKSAQYFCGPFPQVQFPLPTDPGFPASEIDRLKNDFVVPFLEQDVGVLWPKACDGTRFDWDLLVDPGHAVGKARLDSQYLRVNIDPSERYVLSVPGSTRYRLTPDGAGIANLLLAGDWTACGVNAGCVEGAVTSGMLAARAITGGAARTVAWERDRTSLRVVAPVAASPWVTKG